MTITRLICLTCALFLLGFASTANSEMIDDARVTLNGNGHNIDVSYVAFTLDGTVVFFDNAPGISTIPDGGASRLWSFYAPLDVNDFEFNYTCDGGPVTHVVIPAGQFYFHMPLVLVCPSPGGNITLEARVPGPNDAMIVASHHDMLMQHESECFTFKANFPYVCVLWACDTDYEPVFEITPGCSDPCGNPNCPPAVYSGIGYTPMCNPIDNVWGRVFYPIGPFTPGCWCYFFEYQLPVELNAFTAVAADRSVNLRFTTASESENERFEIFRADSPEGEFTEIGRLSSHGDSPTEQAYNYVDSDVLPGQTYWYYPAYVGINGERVERRDIMASAYVSESVVPAQYSLAVYPNPFNPATTIEFVLTNSQEVELAVYDLSGRIVNVLANGSFEAGSHSVSFDASHLPSGIYFARVSGADFVRTQKMVLMK